MRKPTDPATWKEVQDLSAKLEYLTKQHNILLGRFNQQEAYIKVLERKLSQKIRNVEAKR